MSNELRQIEEAILRFAQEARSARTRSGFWPVLGAPLGDLRELDWWPFEKPDVQLHLRELAQDPDLRPAVLHLWFVAVYELANWNTLEANSDTKPNFEPLRKCVSALPVESIDSAPDFRWELDVAATLGLYPRVVSLLRTWRQRGMPDAYLPVAVRALHLLTGPMADTPAPSGVWDPELECPTLGGFFGPYSALVWVDAVTIAMIRTAPGLDGQAKLNTKIVDVERLRELRYWIDVTDHAVIAKEPLFQAIRAWTIYATALLDGESAKLVAAGSLYERLSPPAAITLPDLQSRLLQAATLAYEDGGALDDALRTALLRAEQGGQSASAYRKVAELFTKLERIPDAIRALEKALGDESTERDWLDSLALRLGLERSRGDRVSSALAEAAHQSPFKEQALHLFEFREPWAVGLSVPARERLWAGLFSISSPLVLRELKETAWDQAGDHFGEAVGFELKAKVFAPLSTLLHSQHLTAPGEQWARALRQKATLGQMIKCLSEVQSGRHPTFPVIGEWLAHNLPPLLPYVAVHWSDLTKLGTLRGEAQHQYARTSQEDVRLIFDIALSVLKILQPTKVA